MSWIETRTWTSSDSSVIKGIDVDGGIRTECCRDGFLFLGLFVFDILVQQDRTREDFLIVAPLLPQHDHKVIQCFFGFWSHVILKTVVPPLQCLISTGFRIWTTKLGPGRWLVPIDPNVCEVGDVLRQYVASSGSQRMQEWWWIGLEWVTARGGSNLAQSGPRNEYDCSGEATWHYHKQNEKNHRVHDTEGRPVDLLGELRPQSHKRHRVDQACLLFCQAMPGRKYGMYLCSYGWSTSKQLVRELHSSWPLLWQAEGPFRWDQKCHQHKSLSHAEPRVTMH